MSANTKLITIAVAVSIVFGGAGFYGGTVYEKSAATTQRQDRFAQTPGGNFSGRSGGANGTAQNRQGTMRNGGGFIAGEVTSKDDKSITVQDRNGSSKIILYSDSTTVGKSVDGTANDVTTGENVMVTGTTNSDGSVTAENIQIRPNVPQGNGGQAPATSGN